ncbi:MAG: GGDEF domain-containing protein [Lysobacteraceae bacterium]
MDVNLPLLLLSVSVTVAIGLLVAAVQQPSPVREAQQMWSIGLIAAPLGMTLLKLSESLDVVALAVLAKTVLTAAFVACLLALGRLTGRRPALTLALLPMFVVPLASVWFLIQHPGEPMRSGLLSLVCAALCLATAWLGWSPKARQRWPHARLVASLFALGALLLSTRALLLFGNDAVSSASSDWLLAAGVLVPPLATVGFALAGSARSQHESSVSAGIDDITGLPNRRRFLELSWRTLQDAEDRSEPVAMLSIHAPDMASMRQRFDARVIDQAMRQMAVALCAALRQRDLVGRVDEDGFAATLVGADREQSESNAIRLRDAVAGLRFSVGNVSIPLRVEVGIARHRVGADDVESLLLRAHQASRSQRPGTPVSAAPPGSGNRQDSV